MNTGNELADAATPNHSVSHHRSRKGATSYVRGLCAEECVARAYEAQGVTLLARRWRATAGEIDLILRDGPTLVFCEVKAAKTLDAAKARLTPPQMQRIHMAASEFIGRFPQGQLTDVRFDLAHVDFVGQVNVLQDAFAHF